MFETSILIGWLIRVFTPIKEIWKNSLARRILTSVVSWCGRVYHNSAVVGFIKRDGFMVRFWEISAVSALLAKILNFIPNLLQKLYDKSERAFAGSLLFRAIVFLAKNIPVLAALFFLVTMVVPHNYWDNRYNTIAVFGLLILFLIHAIADKSIKFFTKAIDVYFFIFMITILLSQIFSVYPGLSMRFFVFHLTDFILVFILVSSIRTKEQLATTIEIILVGVALTGLYGVYQGIVGVPVIPSQVDLTLNEGMPGRVYSAFGNSNNYAQVLVMLLPFFLSVILSTKGAQKKIIFFMAAIPPIIALLMSYSRSGWIGFAVAILVLAFLIKPSSIPLMILFGILIMPFLPQTILRRIDSITNLADTSTSTRFDIWKTMWPVINDFWYTGLGLGNDVMSKITYRYPIYTKGVPLHCHNVYLQVWVETGIVGLLSFLGFMARSIKSSLRVIFNKNGDPYIRNFLKAAISGLLGVLAICLVEYVWFYPRVMLIFWLLLGLILAAIGIAMRQEKEGANIDQIK